jgi:hypothetical protein
MDAPERRVLKRYNIRTPLRFRTINLTGGSSDHFTEAMNVSPGIPFGDVGSAEDGDADRGDAKDARGSYRGRGVDDELHGARGASENAALSGWPSRIWDGD